MSFSSIKPKAAYGIFKGYGIVVFTALLFLFPDFFYLLISKEESFAEKMMLGLVSISFTLLLVYLFRNKLRWYSALVYLLAITFGILSSGIIQFYKARMNVNTMGAILNTNANEAAEFIQGYEWIAILVPVILIGLLFLSHKTTPLQLPHSASGKILRVAIVLFAAGSCYFILIKKESAGIFLKNNLYKNYYPIYCLKSVSAYYREEMRVQKNVKKAAAMRFGATRKKSANRSIHVLIIGESGRYASWGVNGYARPTTPRMQQFRHLISLQDAISSHNETVKSVALTITMTGAAKANEHSAQPSILKLFREAGYRTYWISNQNDWGALPIRIHINDADSIHCTVGNKGITDEHDGVLLPVINNTLQGTADKFLVIHLTGNHWSYEKRYPKEFAVFGELNTKTKYSYFDKSRKKELIDIYDNSVLYQDHIIAEIQSMLEKTGSDYTLTYLPDHGENLFDDCRELTGHGTNFTSASFHIPLFITYSESYAQNYPDKVEALLLNKSKPFVVGENLFQTVSDLASIHFPKRRNEWSIASKDFIPFQKRAILLPDLTVSWYEDEVKKESIEIQKCAGKKP